eukprot:6153108-Prymnesium_polylepis.1
MCNDGTRHTENKTSLTQVTRGTADTWVGAHSGRTCFFPSIDAAAVNASVTAGALPLGACHVLETSRADFPTCRLERVTVLDCNRDRHQPCPSSREPSSILRRTSPKFVR